MLKEDELPDFIKELRVILKSVSGVSNVTETVSFSYVCVVDTDESKENVSKVANMITEQAAKNYGLDIEIVAATTKEMELAANKYKEYLESKKSFVTKVN